MIDFSVKFYDYKITTKRELFDSIYNYLYDHLIRTPFNLDVTPKVKNIVDLKIKEYYTNNDKSFDEPLYKHNCSNCVYLGYFIDVNFDKNSANLVVGLYDLYAHIREDMVELIARYGDNEPDYNSFTYFVYSDFGEQEQNMKSINGIYEAFKRYGARCRPNPPKNYPFSFLDIK